MKTEKTNPSRRTRTRYALTAILALLAVGATSQLALAGPAAPAVPSEIAIEAGHQLYLVGHAVGVQIYRCDATPTGYGWSFVAPRADLYGGNGKLIVTHFAGPTWQANDGSAVVAAVDGRANLDPTAIPWLRLAVTSATVGADGDRLAGTTFIQRIATTGGLAPAAGACNAGAAGSTAEVPYTADYFFWKAKVG